MGDNGRSPWWVAASNKIGPMNVLTLTVVFFLMWLVATELRAGRQESRAGFDQMKTMLDTHINQMNTQQFYLWRICVATTAQGGGNAMIECGQGPNGR